MRLDLRGKFLALNIGLVGLVIVGVWAALQVALGDLPERDPVLADTTHVIVLVAVAVGACLALGAAYLGVRFVKRALAGLSHAIETGGMDVAGRRELLVSELAGTYQRLANDLVRVDSSLAEEHTRFEAVLTSIDVGVAAVDGAGRFTVVNPSFLEIFDLPETPVGRLFADIIAVPALDDALGSARQGRTAQAEVKLPDAPGATSRARTIVARAMPLGTAGGAAVTVRDVTSIRLLERVRRDFVANISHELRTPVSVVRASAETLLDGALEDPVHGRGFVEQIERHATRMGNIIEGLLDLARLEAGQQSLAKEPVNLRASALRAVDLAQAQAKARNIVVQVAIPEAATAFADTKGIDQILSNLLENAVKYSGENGSVVLDAESRGGWVRVLVSDDGPGISPDHRERVFERFYRIDKGRSRDTGGSGLGLAIVKHLALAMGGTVGIEPRDPRGSVFWVRLPAGRELPAQAG